jgi:hypothetical protein
VTPAAPRRAALHLRKGERIFRVATTPWAEHKGSEVCWRVISKVRLDGRVEALHFICQRKGGDLIAAHVVFPEAKFGKFIEDVTQAIRTMVPEIPVKVGELTEFDEAEFGPYFVHDPGLDDTLKEKGIRFP